MQDKLQELKARLCEANDLSMAAAVLNWDQLTYMPPGGVAARGRQLGTLSRLAHEKFTDPEVGKLLDDLRAYEEGLPYDSDDASLVRVTRRLYERQLKVPSWFVAMLQEHGAKSYDAWTRARPADDFKMVQPLLEKTLDLSRQLADFFPGYEHIADPLISFADEGMKASRVSAVFGALREKLVPLVKAITAQTPADDECLHQYFPEDKQLGFGLEVIKQFGYDFNRGRQDKTHHPFMTKFSLGDVRITTRVKERDLGEAIFSTMHEAGHAMYELGITREYEGTPLANGTSMAVHESQSRLWENIVGRSLEFWGYFYPRLQEVFPDQLNAVPLETFYRAINKVQPSLIRTDADEVTYNLHPIIRFDLEMQLLDGRLRVRDLPDAWRARYASDIGIAPSDDKDGVLQDVHWFGGLIGGSFQGYTLGNIIGAQFYAVAAQQCPQISDEIGRGEFSALHNWLIEDVYRHGSKFTADELLQRVTGGPLSVDPYIAYLTNKYGVMYHLTQ
jgi:carboxypeptidase Taq